MGCAFRILGLQPISINLLCNFGQAEYLHYPPWASGSSSSSTVKWEQTIILTLQDTCKRQNEVLSQYTRALNKASTKCNYETRTDLFLPSTPSFLPYPSASLTSLISLCLVRFLSHYPQTSPHPHSHLSPSSSPRSSFGGLTEVYHLHSICSDNSLLTCSSPLPAQKITWACWLHGFWKNYTLFQSYYALWMLLLSTTNLKGLHWPSGICCFYTFFF